ncbi:hypothetical protein COLO4_29843 [Corchorus olitorius]|uniref:Uncharacterized protein n=1 Tax=Corchorus olitorius TaxID=93759 RepID=A0A1R3HCX0_9ROSI|nr:hypothetical protein COLO4_29843 [Corchorus olitorius]
MGNKKKKNLHLPAISLQVIENLETHLREVEEEINKEEEY